MNESPDCNGIPVTHLEPAKAADMTNEISVSRVISSFGMPPRYYHLVSPHYGDTPGEACRRCVREILYAGTSAGRPSPKPRRRNGVARTANKIKNENSSRYPKLIIFRNPRRKDNRARSCYAFFKAYERLYISWRDTCGVNTPLSARSNIFSWIPLKNWQTFVRWIIPRVCFYFNR